MNELLNPNELIAWVVGAAVVGGGVLGLIVFIQRFLYICRPNQVLVFSGGQNQLADGSRRGYRVEFGGRAWRKPIVEEVEALDMRIMPIELVVHQAYSEDGIPMNVRAIANVKVASDQAHIGNAIERFLSKDLEEIRRVARETLEGALRGVLAKLTPEDANENRLRFAKELSDEAEKDFHKLGLQLDTLKIQHISDDKEYLDSIGRKKIAEVIRDAEIAESNSSREATMRSAEAKAQGDIARQQAEREIVQKRNEQHKREAELTALVESAQRESKAAGEQARFEAEQQLQLLRQELERLRLTAEVELPWEAGRRARELKARAEAAPIEEDGRALAGALEALATAWSNAGPQARDVFLFQRVEGLMTTIVEKLAALEVREVNLIDPGDGSALPNYVAGFPNTVASVWRALRETTGIDVTSILNQSTPSSER
jgi:flotillin